MNSFKIIALEKNYTARALALFTGAAGDISHALTSVSRPEATALVEAMPERNIADRLLALADYIESIEGRLSDPIITFATSSEAHEFAQTRFEDDILAIINVASSEKLGRVLLYFTTTYLELREMEEGEDSEKIQVVQDNTQPDDAIKANRQSETLIIFKVHPNTYAKYERRAREEIAEQKEEQIDPYARMIVDNIKLNILEKLLFALFHSIHTNERLDDAKQKLGMLLSDKLDPTLVTTQDLITDPEEAQALARSDREEDETTAQRKEVRDRTKQLDKRATDAMAAWLAANPELADEFADPDATGIADEDFVPLEGEEDKPEDADETARMDTSRGPEAKPGKKGKKGQGGLDFEE